MGKKILGWVILVLLLAYVIGAGIWTHARASRDTCQGIDVQIVECHTTDSLTLSGVLYEISRYPHPIIDAPIPSVNTKELEEYLKTLPQFEDIKCNFNTDGRLKVRVTPIIPELRVFEGNQSYYVNKDGKRMDSKAAYYVDVPIVSGTFTRNFQPKDLLPVTRFIQNDPVLKGLIGMVYVENKDNIILVPRIQGHVINLGDTSRLADKRKALMAMYRKVIPYKGWDEYDTISVKFRGQIVATRRDKTPLVSHNVEYEEIELEEATLPDINNL